MGLRILGVRHHSPACARLVGRTIAAVRPRFVLIEGPADMNGRLDELALPHELPIAIFGFRTGDGETRASWCPFCAHSPEWVALATAREVGAELRFVDLPAWHDAFHDVRNRYSDRHQRASRATETLCRRLGVADLDAMWDHLFEQPLDEGVLEQRLAAYFSELRGDFAPEPGDDAREDFMAEAIACAVREAAGQEVVVVCGGFHAPALAARWRDFDGSAWPQLPSPGDARVGSYLVPYSFRRLDSFTGYEAGMPSPAYQDAVWAHGPEAAAETLLVATVERLRARKQPVSAADVIAVSAMAEGLQRLRGHAAVGRVDLLDGLAAGLVKDGLEAPLPWTYRGPLRARTEPLLVEVVAAFSGERIGRLAAQTPRPPLADDVRALLEAHDLVPGERPRRVRLALTEPAGVARSRILHRLRVLRIPGFERLRGPAWATGETLDEEWSLCERVEAHAALIEAAAHGPTLETAAAGWLEEALLRAAGRLAELARLLGDAAAVGIATLGERVLAEVARGALAEPDFIVLGEALARLLGLWRFDALLGAAGHAGLGAVVEAAFARGLWLLEGLDGARTPADPGRIGGVVALRDTLHHGGARLRLEPAAAHDLMRRRSRDLDAPPDVRGAALGFLWSTGFFDGRADGEREGVAAVRRAARPAVLGDFLAGLFALAREQAARAPELVAAVDAVLAEMVERDFLVALPSLRLAFSYFPPAEKERIARTVLALRGRAGADAGDWLRLDASPAAAAAGLAHDAEVTRIARRYGLDGPR